MTATIHVGDALAVLRAWCDGAASALEAKAKATTYVDTKSQLLGAAAAYRSTIQKIDELREVER